jgi:hypothetical protein
MPLYLHLEVHSCAANAGPSVKEADSFTPWMNWRPTAAVLCVGALIIKMAPPIHVAMWKDTRARMQDPHPEAARGTQLRHGHWPLNNHWFMMRAAWGEMEAECWYCMLQSQLLVRTFPSLRAQLSWGNARDMVASIEDPKLKYQSRRKRYDTR